MTMLFSLQNWTEKLMCARVLMRFLVLLSRWTVLCKQIFLCSFPISNYSLCRNHTALGKKIRKKTRKTMEESNCNLSNCQQCLLWACICPELQLCLQFWVWHNWRGGGETSIVFCGEEGNRFQGQNPPK